jgi:recombination protein RecA
MMKKKVQKAPKTIGVKETGDKENTRGASDALLKEIQSKFGEGSIMKLGDTPKVDVGVVPTGSLGLDAALGVGGLPRGRIVEIFGPESSGKTTLTLHVIAEAQKMGGICAFIDAEHAMDPEYAKKLGVNTGELLGVTRDPSELYIKQCEKYGKEPNKECLKIIKKNSQKRSNSNEV